MCDLGCTKNTEGGGAVLHYSFMCLVPCFFAWCQRSGFSKVFVTVLISQKGCRVCGCRFSRGSNRSSEVDHVWTNRCLPKTRKSLFLVCLWLRSVCSSLIVELKKKLFVCLVRGWERFESIKSSVPNARSHREKLSKEVPFECALVSACVLRVLCAYVLRVLCVCVDSRDSCGERQSGMWFRH